MLALVNGTILTMEGKDYKQGTVLINRGKIIATGENIPIPADAEIINVNNQYILPGFIDAHTHTGILEEIYALEGDDVNEISDPITPQIRAIDGINPFDLAFRDALQAGVTTVMVAPGSANVIGGLVSIIKTSGRSWGERIISEEAGLKIAFGENPKTTYGQQKRMPYTRMGAVALLRQAFLDGINYRKKNEKERNLKMESLLKVLDRKIPLRAHAHRADDILTALRVAREFNLCLIIEHCTEGHKIVEELVKAGVSAVIGPSLTNRGKVELKERSFKTAAVLSAAGVPVALTTDHPETPIQYLPLCASLANSEGMPAEKALEAITINAAKILAIDDKFGSIKKGKDADLVILSGHPLDIKSKVKIVITNGELITFNDNISQD